MIYFYIVHSNNFGTAILEMKQPMEFGEKIMNISMHYNIEIDTERRIVVSKIYGMWKQETALAYVEDYKEAVKPLLGGKWARLINLSNWKSSYPDIVEIINELVRWSYENGAEYLAYAIDNPVLLRTLKKMVKIGRTTDTTKMFKTIEEADQFLKDHGY